MKKKTIKKKEAWVVFFVDGREVCAYTLRGTFAGELEATKEQLAFDRGILPSQITAVIVIR